MKSIQTPLVCLALFVASFAHAQAEHLYTLAVFDFDSPNESKCCGKRRNPGWVL